MEAEKVFKEVNEKLDKLCERNSQLNATESNKSEMLKMMDFCLTLMEVKDRKFHDDLQQVRTEVATLKSQHGVVLEQKFKYQEIELNGHVENDCECRVSGDVKAEISFLKKALSEQKEEMKKFQSKHKTQMNELEVEILKLRENEVSLQNQVKRLETEAKDKRGEKVTSVDSKLSMVEREFVEKIPDLIQMLIKTKIFQIERNKIFPLPQVNSAGSQREFVNEPPDYLWKVPEIKKKLDQKSGIYVSEVFPLTGYQLNAWSQLKKKDQRTFVIKLILEDADKQKELLNLELYPRIFIVLRDQSGNEEREDVIRTTFKPFNSKRSSTLNYYTVTFNSLEFGASAYSVDNSISLAFYVESPTQTRHVYSYDGTLFWTVDNYWNRKRMVEKKLLFCHLSPYFYTSPRGYRVQAHIYLNGCDKFTNRGLTVGISFQNGETDSELDLSFPHRTTVTVFNPSNPAKNVTKSVENKEIKNLFYTLNMGSHDVIEDLLDHDVLFYKITTVNM